MSDKKPTAPAARGKAFKPRAGIVRKSKEERDAHAKQEAEKAAARAAAAVKAEGKPAPSNRPNATKKKDATRDNRNEGRGVAGGVFGASSGDSRGIRRSTYAGQSEMLEGQEGVKPSDGPRLLGDDGGGDDQRRRGAGGGFGRGVPGGPAYGSDDEPDETRRDIEEIWISSDEEEEDEEPVIGKGKARATSAGKKMRQGGGLRPVRAPRALAEDKNADAEGADDKMTTKNAKTVEDGYSNEQGNSTGINKDVSADQVQIKQDEPSSPELSKRGKPGPKVRARGKDSKIAIETVEEKAERQRLMEDIEKLREEFLPLSDIKQDEDTDTSGQRTRPEAKLFLFQFPPLVPFLMDEAQASFVDHDGKHQAQESGPVIKSDPDGPAAEATSLEDVADHTAKPSRPTVEGMLTASEPLRLPAGLVGKLNIHKSGKVTLDWGGTDMEVRHGTEVDFLQDAVLVETPSQSNGGEENVSGSRTGTTYGLGQIQRKMVVIPDWQKLYD